jgi:hypothetical protein
MWVLIIVLILAFIIGKFLFDRNQQSARVTMEGGMRNKYRELLKYIMSVDPKTRIFHESADSITLGVSSMSGSTIFILTQTFGTVTIQWRVESNVFGKHKLEWSFDEYLDQEKMIEKISNDTSKYQDNIMSTLGFPRIND